MKIDLKKCLQWMVQVWLASPKKTADRDQREAGHKKKVAIQ